METEKITFPDGNWWEIKKSLTAGMVRAVQELNQKALVPEMDSAGMPLKFTLDTSKINFMESAMTLLFEGTVAWSYGAKTRQVMNDEIPFEHFERVRVRAEALWQASPLAARAIGNI